MSRVKSDLAIKPLVQEQIDDVNRFSPSLPTGTEGIFMQTLAEQPLRTVNRSEQTKSFDVAANVYLMRDDLQTVGEVLPETRERVCDEQMSYLIEGVNRASRTSFTLQRRDGVLVYFNQGEWQPYQSMVSNGVKVAKQEAQHDYRRNFLYQNALTDEDNARQMRGLRPGEQIIWDSPYRQDIEDQFGSQFMVSVGMKPQRKMGFLYRAVGNQDGSVTLETQTVDNSDETAFAAVRRMAQYDPDMSLDVAVRVYDAVLTDKYDQPFYAGRSGAEVHENAWLALKAQQDLIDYHLTRLAELAAGDLEGDALERAVKRQTIGVWKLFKDILDGVQALPQFDRLASNDPALYFHLQHAVDSSYHRAVAQKDVMNGCGGALKMSDDPLEADLGDSFKLIFGDEESRETAYSFNVWAYCRTCQAPPKDKDRKKLCGPCVICKDCDKKLRRKEAVSPVLV